MGMCHPSLSKECPSCKREVSWWLFTQVFVYNEVLADLLYMSDTVTTSFLLSGWSGSNNYFSTWVSFNFGWLSVFISLLCGISEEDSSLHFLVKISATLSLLFFKAESLLTFFMWYEAVMVPVLYLVIFYGSSPEKVWAGYYALLYTSLFSMPFLYVIMGLDSWPNHISPSSMLMWLSMGIFLVKSPIFFLHYWLPKAHVEAPTVGSMLLAGLLLKVGVYGVMIMSTTMNLTPYTSLWACVVGYTFGAFSASVSGDTKAVGAYSSVTHVNLLLFALSSLSVSSSSGGYLISLSHGYVSTLLFYVLGTLYSYNGVRMVYYLSGLSSFGGFLMGTAGLILLGNAGVPPFTSFWGELLSTLSVVNLYIGVALFVSVYFIVAFYYSMYLMVHLLKSGQILLATHYLALVASVGLIMLLDILVLLL